MKPILLILLCVLATSGYSQIPSIWQGNTPGHERDWGCPSNWSANTLPDEFTDVIIPVDESMSDKYPILRGGTTEINSLSIWPGARLSVKGGTLSIIDPGRNNYNLNQIEGYIRHNAEGETFLTADELANLYHKER